MITDPIALLRDAENYLSALHGSVARHDHLAANLACAGCELRDRIAAALPPTDQADECPQCGTTGACNGGPCPLLHQADDEQPGARHVHITIHHPDPTTANTAALCIADLIRGEYSDSLRLTITTDAGARQDGRPATAYGDGKGRVYCIRCAPAVGADVPLTGTDVAPYELCPSCGRHAVDVAAAGARQDGTQP